MDEQLINKLRDKQNLLQMPDGSEGVAVTMQFKGAVPALPRPERKKWLLQHFSSIGKELAGMPVQIDSVSVSVSGQTIEAICSVDRLADLRAVVEPKGLRVDVVRTIQAASH